MAKPSRQHFFYIATETIYCYSFFYQAAYYIGLRLKEGGCKGSRDTLHSSVLVAGIQPLGYPQAIRNDRILGHM